MNEAKEKLIRLLDAVIAGALSVEDFSAQYERVWNFELNDADLTPGEAKIFVSLFDTAAWYTTIKEDRENYPGFKDEETIIEAAQNAWSKLMEA